MGSTGDVIAQWLHHRGEKDWSVKGQSCAAAAAWGAANNGVFVPWWYSTLDARLPGTAVRAVACKSCLDIAVQGATETLGGVRVEESVDEVACTIREHGEPLPEPFGGGLLHAAAVGSTGST